MCIYMTYIYICVIGYPEFKNSFDVWICCELLLCDVEFCSKLWIS